MAPNNNNTTQDHDQNKNQQQQKQQQEISSSNTKKRPSSSSSSDEQKVAIKCPRCDSPNTKFCYYNNYSLSQPRHFCKTCRRYWTNHCYQNRDQNRKILGFCDFAYPKGFES
jgi:hypothetical protein